MTKCRTSVAVFLVGTGLSLFPFAVAAESGDEESAPALQGEPLDDALRGAAEQIMNALRLMVMAIPQYEAPEILENGDIIIRRRHPERSPDGGEPQGTEMGNAYQQDL